MMKEDEEKKKRREDKLKKQQKEERRQQYLKEQAQKEAVQKAQQAEKNPFSVIADKDEEEVMDHDSVVFTQPSSSDVTHGM